MDNYQACVISFQPGPDDTSEEDEALLPSQPSTSNEKRRKSTGKQKVPKPQVNKLTLSIVMSQKHCL